MAWSKQTLYFPSRLVMSQSMPRYPEGCPRYWWLVYHCIPAKSLYCSCTGPCIGATWMAFVFELLSEEPAAFRNTKLSWVFAVSGQFRPVLFRNTKFSCEKCASQYQWYSQCKWKIGGEEWVGIPETQSPWGFKERHTFKRWRAPRVLIKVSVIVLLILSIVIVSLLIAGYST